MAVKDSLLRHLAPFGKPWAVAGETAILPLLAVAIGIWVNPLDPLWINAGFPWVWFAPVILAMRYGPFPGLGGAAVLLLAWLAFNASGWVVGEFPKLNYLGGLILVMLAGEFSSVWLARARRAEGVQAYLDQRLEYLTHQHYLLRLSHDRLEQDLIGRPMAMRDALASLQSLIREQGAAAASPLPGAQGLLRLLAQYCQLEIATIHAASDGEITAEPVATIGQGQNNGQLDADDPLLREAIEAGTLSHLAAALAAGSSPSTYAIAVPMITFDEQLIGVLAVERVPFFALGEEMLQTLNLLVSYYVDGLDERKLAAEIQSEFPACPDDFAAELQRLWRVRQGSLSSSIITVLEFLPRPELDYLALQIGRQRRALDVSWLIDSPQRKVLVTLMPLAGAAAAEGYIARIEEWVRQKSGCTLSEAGVFPHLLPIDETAPLPLLEQLFEICNVPAEARSRRADA
ncbi:hypothetical protein E4Q23_09740 [Candidatus Accumulibacter phosphatis]|uniref:PelD GGDEF domain-containing protein n=1 Tax=Candidatus Accumulibacter phosphatis TaxID=327160 RepID=A0ABX1TZ58_9PROT|nr:MULTISPECIES: PelD GGDEF domain-containing protein [Candidatus Accumulibacter]NMQ28015.1 hypothetical protein [Candidatus Accumulibacter phosphatis]